MIGARLSLFLLAGYVCVVAYLMLCIPGIEAYNGLNREWKKRGLHSRIRLRRCEDLSATRSREERFNQPAFKIEAPAASMTMRFPEELRFDRPFANTFPNLLYFARATNEQWYTPSHYHDHYEICYVAQGKGWFSQEGARFDVGAGDLFVTKPGEGHCGAAEAGQPYTLYAFAFTFERMRDIESAFYQLNLFGSAHDDDGLTAGYWDAILEETDGKRAFAHRRVEGLVMELLVQIVRIYQNRTVSRPVERTVLAPAIRHVLEIVHADNAYLNRIRQLADMVGLSRAQLDREFKRFMGTSLGEYIRTLCLDRAKSLLRQKDDSITEIAQEMGFASIHAFSVFFKRRSGMSPQEYRNAIVSGRDEENR